MQVKVNTAPTTFRTAVNARWAEHILLLSSLVISDAAMVGFGFLLAYFIRFESGLQFSYQPSGSVLHFYQNLVFMLIPVWIGVFWAFGLYDFKNLFSGSKEYAQVFNASTLGIMLVIVSTFFYPEFVIARAWVLMSWGLIAFLVATGRFILRRGVQQMRASGRFMTPVLMVGTNEEAMAIAEQLQSNPRAGIGIAGFVSNNGEDLGEELLPQTPVLGQVSAIRQLVMQYGIQEIIVASTALTREELLDLYRTFGVDSSVNIRMSSGLYEMLTTGVEVQEVGNVPLLSVNKVRLTGVEVVLKRLLDIIGSLAVLTVALPVMVLIGIAIRRDSKGPAIHRRRVVGVGGKVFDAYKFRTMYVDGDERLKAHPELVKELEETGKLKDDPRVTKVGKFLRKTSLDELPQLFNVLRGQMSLVGPRMITEAEQQKYGNWRTNLLTVKPGMTGLWQVSGRSDVSYDRRVTLDMHYIRNYSLWFDLYILWQTIPAVLQRRGAY